MALIKVKEPIAISPESAEKHKLSRDSTNQAIDYPLDVYLHKGFFSPRECEISRLVSKGLPNKAIAAILDISPWTVSTYLRRLFAKLQVHTRTAMITKIVEMKLREEERE